MSKENIKSVKEKQPTKSKPEELNKAGTLQQDIIKYNVEMIKKHRHVG